MHSWIPRQIFLNTRSEFILAYVPLSRRIIMSSNGSDDDCANKTILSKRSSEVSSVESYTRKELKLGTSIKASHSIDDYELAIRDLNSLQNNNKALNLAKNNKPETILPLFKQQCKLAGIKVEDLNKLNIIHVTGTKGKGSTCAFLESILVSFEELRLKVGSYNSPHLVSVTERIRINSKPIDRALFCKHFRYVYDKLRRETQREMISMPGYFSFLTILAFRTFLEENIDCAILEVGVGGEYDPTNIVDQPAACVITTLDLDHTNILGKTIDKIAWTKAGIIKPGRPIFTIEHEHDIASKMIQKRAALCGAPVYVCKPFLPQPDIELGIKGPAQLFNASLACQVAKYLINKLKDKNLSDVSALDQNSCVISCPESDLKNLPQYFRDGLTTCHLPGRCQIIECPDAVFFLDGAHTRKSMENCVAWFKQESNRLDPDAYQYLLFNVIGERDKKDVMKPLLSCGRFEHVVFSTNMLKTSVQNLSGTPPKDTQNSTIERAIENARTNSAVWSDLTKISGCSVSNTTIRSSTVESLEFLCNNTISSRGKKHVLITGSLHFVGAMIETINMFYSA